MKEAAVKLDKPKSSRICDTAVKQEMAELFSDHKIPLFSVNFVTCVAREYVAILMKVKHWIVDPEVGGSRPLTHPPLFSRFSPVE